jgi:hypothetical protein
VGPIESLDAMREMLGTLPDRFVSAITEWKANQPIYEPEYPGGPVVSGDEIPSPDQRETAAPEIRLPEIPAPVVPEIVLPEQEREHAAQSVIPSPEGKDGLPGEAIPAPVLEDMPASVPPMVESSGEQGSSLQELVPLLTRLADAIEELTKATKKQDGGETRAAETREPRLGGQGSRRWAQVNDGFRGPFLSRG